MPWLRDESGHAQQQVTLAVKRPWAGRETHPKGNEPVYGSVGANGTPRIETTLALASQDKPAKEQIPKSLGPGTHVLRYHNKMCLL